MPVAPFKVKAVYEYKSAETDDLNFPNGQIITVIDEEDDDWYSGEYLDATGKRLEGIFPKNFVEKYEPEIPSRPSRPARARKDVEPPSEPAAPTSVAAEHVQPPEPEEEPVPQVHEAEIAPDFSAKNNPQEISQASPISQAASVPIQRSTSSAAPKPPVEAPKPAASKPAPPQVAEKPMTGSFRDRIAAFNKPAAPPVAPFKPGGQGGSASSGFIKKPFVAPPPSKNAYVPPPREPPPQKVFRREEDVSQEVDQPEEHATISQQAETEATEAQPKPTSLKERIALLQKQQLEQARRAEGALKKEKPKKPPKRHTDPSEAAEPADVAPRPSLERVDSGDTVGKKSVDFADDESGPLRGHQSRQATGYPALATPPPPSRELLSDTNDADDSGAGDTEEAQDTSAEEERHQVKRPLSGTRGSLQAHPQADVEEDEDAEGAGETEAQEDEEEEEDPEVRRRMEIRERMAKMSGGMGMMGMFGPPGGMSASTASKKSKPAGDGDRHTSTGHDREEATARAPPVPIMALPGMSRPKEPEPAEESEEAESDIEDAPSRATPRAPPAVAPSPESFELPPPPPKRTSTDRPAPPIPQERAAPPPPPRESRAAPAIPSRDHGGSEAPTTPSEGPGAPLSPHVEKPLSPGEVSDDEEESQEMPGAFIAAGRPQSREALPKLPGAPPIPLNRPPATSNLDTFSPTSPTFNEKRASRAPPPVPISSPTITSPQTRAPPPPPPGPPSRKSTSDTLASTKHQVDDDSEEEVTEYDGDYDTDIASSAKHKDALKSHDRDSSLDESTLTDEAPSKPAPTSPPGRIAPPLPPTNAPRDVPPPPPQHAPRNSRQSADMPRVAPPPVPPVKETSEEYDPFRYSLPDRGLPSPSTTRPPPPPIPQSPSEDLEGDDLYDASPVTSRPVPPPPAERGPPLPPSAAPPPPSIVAPPPSADVGRPRTQPRRSMEQSRPAAEQGFMASDIDLGQTSYWWAQENVPPPSLQNRSDILYEMEASTSVKRGGKSSVSKDVYILYMDYSQSTISAVFDAAEPHNVNFEQRHERPPPPLRQDQLENASSQFGARIAEAAHSKQNTTVGDGSSHALVLELIKPLGPSVLAPIGTRAYGALVYANLANASTQQFDEIRAGDVVTFRNAKFAGHRGPMHAKYATEAGRPDHVAVVLDWDGTKKKIRVWEQGRDTEAEGGGKSKAAKKGAKVKEESYKVGDLRSGEVRVWRVMARSWVGWDK